MQVLGADVKLPAKFKPISGLESGRCMGGGICHWSWSVTKYSKMCSKNEQGYEWTNSWPNTQSQTWSKWAGGEPRSARSEFPTQTNEFGWRRILGFGLTIQIIVAGYSADRSPTVQDLVCFSILRLCGRCWLLSISNFHAVYPAWRYVQKPEPPHWKKSWCWWRVAGDSSC